MVVDVIIPTYKPDKKFIDLVEKLNKQTVLPRKIIVMNTEEKLWKVTLPKNAYNVEVHHIAKQEFDHGKTRDIGVSMSDADICVLMTMDAVPVDNTLLEELIKPLLEEDGVAASYGRQMAYDNSSYTEKLTREYNYPAKPCIKSKEDIERLQIKAFFCSNVCCAYDRKIYVELGGFIHKTIFNEDMIYAAKAVKAGYKIAYAADAKVYHSHEFTGAQQFHRNFDNGVSHAQNPEVFEGIKQEGEGMRMVKMVLSKLVKKGHLLQAIRYIWVTGCKYIGFKLGCRYTKLPKWLVMRCTSDKSYFSIS